MKSSDFYAAIEQRPNHTNQQFAGRAILGAKYHLVDGMPVAKAAAEAGCSRNAIYKALRKLPRARCPTCGQFTIDDHRPLPPGLTVRTIRAE